MTIVGWTSDGLDRTGHLKLADITLVAINSGTSTLDHENNHLANQYGNEIPNQVWIDGTFNCPCPVPYTISGYTFNKNGDPENNATVRVINLNTSKKWDATTSPADNSYELTLNVGVDVNKTEILRLIAKDGVEWVNVTDHEVTQDEIEAGGVSNLNLTLDEFYLDHERECISIAR